MFEGKTIFVAPLDWGLGHASRCVALVRRFLPGNKVIIGTTAVTRELMTYYFPGVEQAELPSYNIRYSRTLPLWLCLALRLPDLYARIRKEKKITARLIREKKIDVLVSDNRYGVFHADLPSFMVCHQLNLLTPVFPGVASALHRVFLKKFTAVWVPDQPDHLLSGALSKNSRLAATFIGPLSALSEGGNSSPGRIKYLALLSGPEPQRTVLERIISAKLEKAEGRHVLVRGTSAPGEAHQPSNVEVRNLVAGEELRNLILGAETVICRSGYSTLMDLFVLRKSSMILIPTPGQAEQQYLAGLWKERFGATVVRQEKLKELLL